MKNQLSISTLSLFTTLLLAGCASAGSKALDAKVAQETEVKNRQELQAEASKTIENDADLSSDQKKQLFILQTTISGKLDDLSSQSIKLRSVLIEELLSPNYSLDEVGLIKARLKKVEDNKLSVMFDGIDQASSILGRQASKHSRAMRALLEDRSIGRE